MAAICRGKGWLRPSEPDDLEHEGLWCAQRRATECEVLRSRYCSQVLKGSTDPITRNRGVLWGGRAYHGMAILARRAPSPSIGIGGRLATPPLPHHQGIR